MGSDDDGVAALQGHEGLHRRSRIRTGGGDERGDDSNRLGDLDEAARGILLDHADRADAAHVGEQPGHASVDLRHLVVVGAEAALIDSEAGQGLCVAAAHDRPPDRRDQFVDALLIPVGDRRLSRASASDDLSHLVGD